VLFQYESNYIVLAAVSTVMDDVDDLKDLYSPKSKETSYRVLFLGICF